MKNEGSPQFLVGSFAVGRRPKRWRATALQDAGAFAARPADAKRLGVRQPSGALARADQGDPTARHRAVRRSVICL